MAAYTGPFEDIKREIQEEVARGLETLLAGLDADRGKEIRQVEKAVWALVLKIGRLLMAMLVAECCRRTTTAELSTKGLRPSQVQMRTDGEYTPSMMTTFGPVRFPLFAYFVKDRFRMGKKKTYVPARAIFPLVGKCKTSPLCLEWEARLGADHAFRMAQEELAFFTHGATSVEDNTIERHMLKISSAISQDWLYLPSDEIRKVLANRATRDAVSGLPALYMSSDAHSLRRYVSDTWDAQWKMSNGIRLWCIDRHTGETIHLGGEFTWGDCRHVATLFAGLISKGILPADGDYGEGVRARLIWLSDGMPWFEDHILPLFDRNAVEVILDVYHMLDRLKTYAAAVFKGRPKEKAKWCARIDAELLGPSKCKTTASKKRKGHKKTAREARCPDWDLRLASDLPEDSLTPQSIVSLIAETDETIAAWPQAKQQDLREAQKSLVNYVEKNAYRANYAAYRYRKLQIGSGAMESIHRSGSQLRTKRPGARWLPETSQAIFNWRMLKIVGRWEEFWSQPGLEMKFAGIWGESPVQYELHDAA